jgi:hypothetical protein
VAINFRTGPMEKDATISIKDHNYRENYSKLKEGKKEGVSKCSTFWNRRGK